MFNMQKSKKIAQMPYEKYHRKENVGPKADDKAPIHEKKLPHRDGFEQTVTEDQLGPEQKLADSDKAQILEKELESGSSPYTDLRSSAADLSTPPMNVLVEKIRQNRQSEYKESKIPHWSHTFNEKKQQGALPKWPKIAPQHDKPVLGNDPQRFSASNANPNDYAKDTIKPLTGNITTADIDKVADGIKTGAASDYDTAILAILRLTAEERRELTNIEKRTIVDLKIARTKKLMAK